MLQSIKKITRNKKNFRLFALYMYLVAGQADGMQWDSLNLSVNNSSLRLSKNTLDKSQVPIINVNNKVEAEQDTSIREYYTNKQNDQNQGEFYCFDNQGLQFNVPNPNYYVKSQHMSMDESSPGKYKSFSSEKYNQSQEQYMTYGSMREQPNENRSVIDDSAGKNLNKSKHKTKITKRDQGRNSESDSEESGGEDNNNKSFAKTKGELIIEGILELNGELVHTPFYLMFDPKEAALFVKKVEDIKEAEAKVARSEINGVDITAQNKELQFLIKYFFDKYNIPLFQLSSQELVQEYFSSSKNTNLLVDFLNKVKLDPSSVDPEVLIEIQRMPYELEVRISKFVNSVVRKQKISLSLTEKNKIIEQIKSFFSNASGMSQGQFLECMKVFCNEEALAKLRAIYQVVDNRLQLEDPTKKPLLSDQFLAYALLKAKDAVKDSEKSALAIQEIADSIEQQLVVIEHYSKKSTDSKEKKEGRIQDAISHIMHNKEADNISAPITSTETVDASIRMKLQKARMLQELIRWQIKDRHKVKKILQETYNDNKLVLHILFSILDKETLETLVEEILAESAARSTRKGGSQIPLSSQGHANQQEQKREMRKSAEFWLKFQQGGGRFSKDLLEQKQKIEEETNTKIIVNKKNLTTEEKLVSLLSVSYEYNKYKEAKANMFFLEDFRKKHSFQQQPENLPIVGDVLAKVKDAENALHKELLKVLLESDTIVIQETNEKLFTILTSLVGGASGFFQEDCVLFRVLSLLFKGFCGNGKQYIKNVVGVLNCASFEQQLQVLEVLKTRIDNFNRITEKDDGSFIDLITCVATDIVDIIYNSNKFDQPKYQFKNIMEEVQKLSDEEALLIKDELYSIGSLIKSCQETYNEYSLRQCLSQYHTKQELISDIFFDGSVKKNGDMVPKLLKIYQKNNDVLNVTWLNHQKSYEVEERDFSVKDLEAIRRITHAISPESIKNIANSERLRKEEEKQKIVSLRGAMKTVVATKILLPSEEEVTKKLASHIQSIEQKIANLKAVVNIYEDKESKKISELSELYDIIKKESLTANLDILYARNKYIQGELQYFLLSVVVDLDESEKGGVNHLGQLHSAVEDTIELLRAAFLNEDDDSKEKLEKKRVETYKKNETLYKKLKEDIISLERTLEEKRALYNEEIEKYSQEQSAMLLQSLPEMVCLYKKEVISYDMLREFLCFFSKEISGHLTTAQQQAVLFVFVGLVINHIFNEVKVVSPDDFRDGERFFHLQLALENKKNVSPLINKVEKGVSYKDYESYLRSLRQIVNDYVSDTVDYLGSSSLDIMIEMCIECHVKEFPLLQWQQQTRTGQEPKNNEKRFVLGDKFVAIRQDVKKTIIEEGDKKNYDMSRLGAFNKGILKISDNTTDREYLCHLFCCSSEAQKGITMIRDSSSLDISNKIKEILPKFSALIIQIENDINDQNLDLYIGAITKDLQQQEVLKRLYNIYQMIPNSEPEEVIKQIIINKVIYQMTLESESEEVIKQSIINNTTDKRIDSYNHKEGSIKRDNSKVSVAQDNNRSNVVFTQNKRVQQEIEQYSTESMEVKSYLLPERLVVETTNNRKFEELNNRKFEELYKPCPEYFVVKTTNNRKRIASLKALEEFCKESPLHCVFALYLGRLDNIIAGIPTAVSKEYSCVEQILLLRKEGEINVAITYKYIDYIYQYKKEIEQELLRDLSTATDIINKYYKEYIEHEIAKITTTLKSELDDRNDDNENISQDEQTIKNSNSHSDQRDDIRSKVIKAALDLLSPSDHPSHNYWSFFEMIINGVDEKINMCQEDKSTFFAFKKILSEDNAKNVSISKKGPQIKKIVEKLSIMLTPSLAEKRISESIEDIYNKSEDQIWQEEWSEKRDLYARLMDPDTPAVPGYRKESEQKIFLNTNEEIQELSRAISSIPAGGVEKVLNGSHPVTEIVMLRKQKQIEEEKKKKDAKQQKTDLENKREALRDKQITNIQRTQQRTEQKMLIGGTIIAAAATIGWPKKDLDNKDKNNKENLPAVTVK